MSPCEHDPEYYRVDEWSNNLGVHERKISCTICKLTWTEYPLKEETMLTFSIEEKESSCFLDSLHKALCRCRSLCAKKINTESEMKNLYGLALNLKEQFDVQILARPFDKNTVGADSRLNITLDEIKFQFFTEESK